MYRHQSGGPSPQRNNSGQPQNRRLGPYPPQGTAVQKRIKHQQPVKGRKSGQMKNSSFPSTQTMYDPNSFAETPYEYQEAEDSTAQPIISQLQHTASSVSNDTAQSVSGHEDLAAFIAQNEAWNDKLENEVDHALEIVSHLHEVITKTAAMAQSPAFMGPQPDDGGWNVHDGGGPAFE